MYECYVYNNGCYHFQKRVSKLCRAKSFMSNLCGSNLKGKIQGENGRIFKWYNKDK